MEKYHFYAFVPDLDASNVATIEKNSSQIDSVCETAENELTSVCNDIGMVETETDLDDIINGVNNAKENVQEARDKLYDLNNEIMLLNDNLKKHMEELDNMTSLVAEIIGIIPYSYYLVPCNKITDVLAWIDETKANADWCSYVGANNHQILFIFDEDTKVMFLLKYGEYVSQFF